MMSVSEVSGYTDGVKFEPLPPGLNVLQEAPYLEVEAIDADAFIGALSPTTGFGGKHPYKSLLYRGQANSTWSLIPTARRKEGWPPPGSARPNGEPDIWANRLIWEATSLLSFCRNADAQASGVGRSKLSSVEG
jgi:hypothetical protein